jgi:KDO2-lipid IV(A) lauroyltransferase
VPMLARRFDCPVHPARCIRLPGNRYRLEIHEALELVRDADGDINIEASTQLLNDVVEGWVREHPGQWMWFHKRWVLSGRRRGRRWKAKPGSKRGTATTSK